jgi:hypothetical protein
MTEAKQRHFIGNKAGRLAPTASRRAAARDDNAQDV